MPPRKRVTLERVEKEVAKLPAGVPAVGSGVVIGEGEDAVTGDRLFV